MNDICFDKESSVDLLASVSDDFTCRLWSVKDLQNSVTFHLESPGKLIRVKYNNISEPFGEKNK